MFEKTLYTEYAENKNAKNEAASFSIVTDTNEITAFENETGKPVGIIDNTPYYRINLDLCKDKTTGKLFRYAHIEYPNNGKTGAAVLVVLKTNEQDLYVLERHYRPITNRYHYEIPRGFTNISEIDSRLTAIREVYEETGIQIEQQNIRQLGTVFPDTGLCNAQVGIYIAEITASENISLAELNKTEDIHGYKIINKEEFRQMTADDEINDSFTLSAMMKYETLSQI